MTKFLKSNYAMAGAEPIDAPGENIAFKDFLGPHFFLALDSLVDALPPQARCLAGRQSNAIFVRELKDAPAAFLHPKDLQFRSGETVLLSAIDEELWTVNLTLMSLDLTTPHATVKVHAACGTNWQSGRCAFLRLAAPKCGEWFRFSVASDLETITCELDALFARGWLTQILRHTAMTTRFLLQPN